MPPQKCIYCGADFGSTIALNQWFLTCMEPFPGFDGETSPANQTHGKAFFCYRNKRSSSGPDNFGLKAGGRINRWFINRGPGLALADAGPNSKTGRGET